MRWRFRQRALEIHNRDLRLELNIDDDLPILSSFFVNWPTCPLLRLSSSPSSPLDAQEEEDDEGDDEEYPGDFEGYRNLSAKGSQPYHPYLDPPLHSYIENYLLKSSLPASSALSPPGPAGVPPPSPGLGLPYRKNAHVHNTISASRHHSSNSPSSPSSLPLSLSSSSSSSVPGPSSKTFSPSCSPLHPHPDGRQAVDNRCPHPGRRQQRRLPPLLMGERRTCLLLLSNASSTKSISKLSIALAPSNLVRIQSACLLVREKGSGETSASTRLQPTESSLRKTRPAPSPSLRNIDEAAQTDGSGHSPGLNSLSIRHQDRLLPVSSFSSSSSPSDRRKISGDVSSERNGHTAASSSSSSSSPLLVLPLQILVQAEEEISSSSPHRGHHHAESVRGGGGGGNENSSGRGEALLGDEACGKETRSTLQIVQVLRETKAIPPSSFSSALSRVGEESPAASGEANHAEDASRKRTGSPWWSPPPSRVAAVGQEPCVAGEEEDRADCPELPQEEEEAGGEMKGEESLPSGKRLVMSRSSDKESDSSGHASREASSDRSFARLSSFERRRSHGERTGEEEEGEKKEGLPEEDGRKGGSPAGPKCRSDLRCSPVHYRDLVLMPPRSTVQLTLAVNAWCPGIHRVRFCVKAVGAAEDEEEREEDWRSLTGCRFTEGSTKNATRPILSSSNQRVRGAEGEGGGDHSQTEAAQEEEEARRRQLRKSSPSSAEGGGRRGVAGSSGSGGVGETRDGREGKGGECKKRTLWRAIERLLIVRPSIRLAVQPVSDATPRHRAAARLADKLPRHCPRSLASSENKPRTVCLSFYGERPEHLREFRPFLYTLLR